MDAIKQVCKSGGRKRRQRGKRTMHISGVAGRRFPGTSLLLSGRFLRAPDSRAHSQQLLEWSALLIAAISAKLLHWPRKLLRLVLYQRQTGGALASRVICLFAFECEHQGSAHSRQTGKSASKIFVVGTISILKMG